MAILFGITAFLAPLVMLVGTWGFPVMRVWIEGLALLCAYVFGLTAAIYISIIISQDTMLTTDIHRVFMNPLFQATGAYLGVYVLYKLALGWLKLWRE